MKLTTGFDFQGYFITDYIDVYFDEILVGLGFGKSILSSIDNVFSSFSGGEATEMIDKLNNVKASLRKRMIEKAEKAGANALIGIDFESSRLGDLLMVSMTATAVKIEKIIEPLPLTAEAAERKQTEREKAENARIEAERKQAWEKERREKIKRGEAPADDKEELMNRLKRLDSVKEMLAEVQRALSMDMILLSEEQLKKLENCREIERLYGKRAGVNRFLRSIEEFLS